MSGKPLRLAYLSLCLRPPAKTALLVFFLPWVEFQISETQLTSSSLCPVFTASCENTRIFTFPGQPATSRVWLPWERHQIGAVCFFFKLCLSGVSEQSEESTDGELFATCGAFPSGVKGMCTRQSESSERFECCCKEKSCFLVTEGVSGPVQAA